MREQWAVFLMAVQFLTRVPVSSADLFTEARLAAAVRYYPLVGVLVGAVAGAVFWLAHLVFPITLAVVLATVASLWVTGAFHEDGFADACDGLGGGATREQALEIMRDSRLGTYGASGLGLLLAIKILALAAAPAVVIPWLLVAAHAASGASAVIAIATGRYAREAGAAKPVADGVASVGLALALATGAAAVAPSWHLASPVAMLAALAGLVLGHLVMRGLYERKLGGYTGDCLGAVQQTSEVGYYLGAVAVL
ncbi:MAG: adenosylcobinamide-GDP ribazoletransferase [Deltaproteobacteria bacterium]|nr:adenosylcobinamide-GDP ribazoletransferase [Deltaproteobacteria bacterium]